MTAATVAASAADESFRQQRRAWQGWREHRGSSGGRDTHNNNNNDTSSSSAWPRQFWGELEVSASSSRGRGGGNGRDGGRRSGWGRGSVPASGRGRALNAGVAEPMDVVRQNGGEEVGVLATTTASGRGGCGGGRREDMTGMAFLRLMEAVLGTLAGARGGCDETSCAVRMPCLAFGDFWLSLRSDVVFVVVAERRFAIPPSSLPHPRPS